MPKTRISSPIYNKGKAGYPFALPLTLYQLILFGDF